MAVFVPTDYKSKIEKQNESESVANLYGFLRKILLGLPPILCPRLVWG